MGSLTKSRPKSTNPEEASAASDHLGDSLSPKAAKSALGGSGSELPHLDRIQASFGQHDVSGVRAHTGSGASGAAKDMGARAFAVGQDVALGSTDLHTVAHEAAHTVQQQGGVQLKGGVGAPGDRFERHADAVADRVVRGESAEGLLDSVAGGGGHATPALQMDYDPSSGVYGGRPSKPSTLSGSDEEGDSLTAHHLYPWNKIRSDLNDALTSKSRSKMEKLIAFAETSVPEGFWEDLEKEASERSPGFTNLVDQLAASVCWAPHNVFMGPLGEKRGDDPGERLDTAYSKSGLPTPASALAELTDRGGGIGSREGLAAMLATNVQDASGGEARPYDPREWSSQEKQIGRGAKRRTINSKKRRGKVPLKAEDEDG